MINSWILSYVLLLLVNSPQTRLSTGPYTVEKTNYATRDINQLLPDQIWEKANVLTDFSAPWRTEDPQPTEFRALYNQQFLFLKYTVTDENILIYEHKNPDQAVGQSDRVEIFFRQDHKLAPYYGLEIAPNGLIMDYKARLYRKIDQEWNWPRQYIYTQGTTTGSGYTMEVVISLKFLREIGVLKNHILEAGIYRGDCIALPDQPGEQSDIKWITWIDPGTEKPDFHIPESFGTLILNNKE